jgi:hypothetical protein
MKNFEPQRRSDDPQKNNAAFIIGIIFFWPLHDIFGGLRCWRSFK